MIREMSQLLISQEMGSTRELNFFFRRFNRYGYEQKHTRLIFVSRVFRSQPNSSDEEVYDTFSRSKSAQDLTKNLQMASVWDVEINNNNEINHGISQHNLQQLLKEPHAKYEAHFIQGRVLIFLTISYNLSQYMIKKISA